MADNEIASLLSELSKSQKDSTDPAFHLDTQQTTLNVAGVNTAVNYTLEPYEPPKLNTRRLQRRRNRANVYANELFLNQAKKKKRLQALLCRHSNKWYEINEQNRRN